VALNNIFKTNYSEKILCRIGVKVGADIPFCIVGGTALALDTGAVVAPLTDVEGYYIVVVKPEDGVSTKEAYDAVDSLTNMKHTKNKAMLEHFADGEIHDALKLCGNVFEQALEVPGRVDIKDVCNKNSAVASCMTGSGSAVYGIFDDLKAAEKSIDELKTKFANVYLCTPEKAGVEIIEVIE
jgi:4-diphosphocytidyl-2-C-methyl-D-erythritol kinase